MMAKNEGYLFDPQLRDTFISVIAEGVLVRRYSPDGSLNQIKLWMSDESTLTWLVEGDFSSEESVSLSDIVKVNFACCQRTRVPSLPPSASRFSAASRSSARLHPADRAWQDHRHVPGRCRRVGH